MTAIERALVVYAEAKGYEIEVQSRGQIDKWGILEQPTGFNFAFNRYRLRDPRNMRKVCDSLYAEYLPNIPEKTISEMVQNIKKYKPAGFSCKSGLEEVSELLEKNNVKIGVNSDPNIIPNYDNFINDFVEDDLDRPKEEEFDVKAHVKSLVETPAPHKFTLDMKFKEGDKVKVKPNFKDDNIYEVCGFQYYTHANGQCSGISYQMVDSEGECGHWAREDALELCIETKQPEAIPATEEELKEIDRGMICIKNKQTGQFGWVMKTDPIPEGMYIFDPVSKTWQDWSSK